MKNKKNVLMMRNISSQIRGKSNIVNNKENITRSWKVNKKLVRWKSENLKEQWLVKNAVKIFSQYEKLEYIIYDSQVKTVSLKFLMQLVCKKKKKQEAMTSRKILSKKTKISANFITPALWSIPLEVGYLSIPPFKSTPSLLMSNGAKRKC